MRSRKSSWLIPILVLACVFSLTASIPNTPTGTWQTWNAMGDVRSGAAAVLLQDGKVLIIGGTNANGPVASADLFGTDGNFLAAAAMQTPRSGHTATVLSDGRVLVTGGVTSGGGAVNTAEIYDPSADSWSAPTTMVDARAGQTASLLSDGRVLLAGGHDSTGNALSSLEIFDPASGKFSSAGAMSVPRMNHAAATLGDGRVLIIGGTTDGTNALASIDIYDPSAGTVSAGPALSTPRMSATATTTLDGKVAVIGGNNGAAAGSQDLASAEIFDPATGQLSPSASSLVTARSGHQAFLLPKNNAILVLGGSSAGTDLNSAELYYSWADSFQATGAMSVARPGLTGSALSLDGRFLAAGGTGLASTELYGFATVKTDASDYAPGTTVNISGSGWQPGETVTLTLRESPLIDTPPTMTAVADSNGNISNNQFSPDSYDVNIRFYLTAVGQTSAFQAQNTFTDAGPDNTSMTVSCSPNPVTVNTGTTCTAQVNDTESGAPKGYPQGAVKFSLTVGSGTFSPSDTCTLARIGSTVNSSCSVTLTPSASGPATVKGQYNASPNSWNNSNATTPLTVNPNVSTSTTVSSSQNPSTYDQSVTFTAAVSPNSGTTIPTGSVAFVIDGGSSAPGTASTCPATAPANSLCATYSTSTLTVNGGIAHTVQANYTHTGNFADSIGTLSAGQTVNPLTVTVTPDAGQHKSYGAADPTLTYTSTPALVTGDSFSGMLARDAGTNVGSYNITQGSLALSANYTLAFTAGVTFEIQPRPLTVKANDLSRVYGDSTPAFSIFLSAGSFGYSDTLSSLGTPSFSTAPANPGVGSYAITVSGLSNANYTITYDNTGALTVTPRPVTVKANAVSRVYGDSTPAFSIFLSAGSFGYSDTLSSLGTPSFSTTPANPGVGSHAITVSGLSNVNYTITYDNTGVLTVTPRPLTVKANDLSRVYGDSTPAFSIFLSVGSFGYSDNAASLGTPSFSTTPANPGVGSYAITVSGLSNANYTITYDNTGVLTVTPRPVTVKANAVSRVYGDSTPAFSVFLSVGSFGYSDNAASLGTPSFSTTPANPGVGSYAITVSGLSNANYTITYDNTGVLTVTPRPVTVKANDLSRVYGDSTPAFSIFLSGGSFGYSDTLSSLGTPSFSTTPANPGVGSHAITVSGLSNANYTITYDNTGVLTVTPRPVTVKANDLSRVYGDSTPAFSIFLSVGSFGYSDNAASLGTPSFSTTPANPGVGSYAITVSGLSNANYTITYDNTGVLTVTPRPVTVKANAVSRVYGDSTPAFSIFLSVGSFGYSDNAASLGTPSFSTTPANPGVGSYAITVSGLSNANYTITYDNTGVLTVTPRPVTVKANDLSRVYGDSTPAFSIFLSGGSFGYSDTLSSLGTPSFSTTPANPGVGSYAITVSGLSNANYTITYDNIGVLTVTPRPITVTAVLSNRVYDGSTSSSSTPAITSGSLAYTDSNGFTESYDNKNVGTAKTMTPAGAVNDGNGGNNYSVTFVSANLGTITPRPITVTAVAQTKVYGTPDPPLTYGVTSTYIPPIVSGDGFTGALSRDAGENVATGPYAIRLGTLTASTNYSITFVGAYLTITKADSKVVVSTSLTPSTLNQSVTFTATASDISPTSIGTPTGSVTFYLDGTAGTVLGTTTLSSIGVGSIATTAVPVNSHSIIAVYNGDGNFTGSQGSTTQLVQYASGGICAGDVGHMIRQPINSDGTSVFKQKSTVPAKFAACDANGNSIGTAGVVSSFYLVKIVSGTVVNVVDETVDSTTPDTMFRWDPTGQQWIFNMNTKSLSANATYYYTITLNDASTISFMFGLK